MLSQRHYQIFKIVAETGSFTKAAKELYITQSAVSHTIRELEKDMELDLFDRSFKKIRLTLAGQRLLEEIQPALTAWETLGKRLESLKGRAPIQVVSSITIASNWLPGILKEFEAAYPDLDVYVQVASAAKATEILRRGEADLALVEGTEPQGDFLCRHFSEYPLRIVCAPGYPGIDHRLTLREFSKARLLLRESGSAIRDTFDSQLFLQGYTVHPRWESVNSTALLEAAKAGLGLTVLPETLVMREVEKGNLIFVEVEEMELKNDLIAVRFQDKYMTPPLLALWEQIGRSR